MMDSPTKSNDCYFYYYSTCIKGDNCVFRHEPLALGCETMCAAWQQGKCMDRRCKLRHMELRKNRKQIPCYWETQPGGCRKKYCPFLHKHPNAHDGIIPAQIIPSTAAQPVSSVPDSTTVEQPSLNSIVPTPVPAPTSVQMLWPQQRQPVVLDSAILGVLPGSNDLMPRRMVAHAHAHGIPHAHAHAHALPHAHAHAHAHALPHPHEPQPSAYASLPVDNIVVNFEEESDNESAPSFTPTKNTGAEAVDAQELGPPKSEEMELLEKIQAETAAFYDYGAPVPIQPDDSKLIKLNLSSKYNKSLDELSGIKSYAKKSLDFKVLSLDEIRAKKINKPIKLSTKSKITTQTTSGKKIIKVVKSNSVIYKTLTDAPAPKAFPPQTSAHKNSEMSRKRTFSETSEFIVQENELIDNCHNFKKIKTDKQTPRPILQLKTKKTKPDDSSTELVSSSDDVIKSDDDVEFVTETCDDDNVELLDDIYKDLKETNKDEVIDLCEDDDIVITVTDVELDVINNFEDENSKENGADTQSTDIELEVINNLEDDDSKVNAEEDTQSTDVTDIDLDINNSEDDSKEKNSVDTQNTDTVDVDA